MECARGMRLCLLVTATMETSREVVAGGHRECPSSTTDPPRGGVTSWAFWEKGQVGTGNISEVGCARSSWQCPRGPDPHVTKQERGRARSQAEPAAMALFSIPPVSKGCWKRNHREGRNTSPERHVPPFLQGMGTGASLPLAWWLKQIFQVWLPEPLLPVPVFGKFPQHGHHVVVEFRWRRLRF